MPLNDLTKIHDLLSDVSSFDPYRLGGYVIALTALALACGAVKLTGRAALWSVRQGWGVLVAGWRRLTRTAPERPWVAAILQRMKGPAVWDTQGYWVRWPDLQIYMSVDADRARLVEVKGINVAGDLTSREKSSVGAAARKAIGAWRERERLAREQLVTEALRPAANQQPLKDLLALAKMPPKAPLPPATPGVKQFHYAGDGTIYVSSGDGTWAVATDKEQTV